MVIGQYVSKKSENWYLGSSYIETIGFRRPARKKVFFILRNTLSPIGQGPFNQILFPKVDVYNRVARPIVSNVLEVSIIVIIIVIIIIISFH